MKIVDRPIAHRSMLEMTRRTNSTESFVINGGHRWPGWRSGERKHKTRIQSMMAESSSPGWLARLGIGETLPHMTVDSFKGQHRRRETRSQERNYGHGNDKRPWQQSVQQSVQPVNPNQLNAIR